LIGSILANSLLVLDWPSVGGLKHGRLHYDAESPRLIVSLMMPAVAALTIPTWRRSCTPAAGTKSR
jgi:Ca2+/H+ antiporter